jgi:integrase/recombinase XerD
VCATQSRRSEAIKHNSDSRKGHESLTSTQAYLHADMQQKQEAIEKTAPPGSRQKRYQPPDPLLEFLENL